MRRILIHRKKRVCLMFLTLLKTIKYNVCSYSYMSRLIEESDIDDWFNEEKIKLADSMMAALEKGANPEKEKEKFNKAFWKLFHHYDKMHRNADAYKLRQKKLRAPFEKFAQWRKEKDKEFSSWRRLTREKLKKEWFEFRYRRMFKIKQRKI